MCGGVFLELRKKIALSVFTSIAIILILFICCSQEVDSNTVTIGVISTTDQDYEKYAFLTELAEEDLNQICNELNSDVRFSFNVSSGEDNPGRVLEQVMDLWSNGVYFFVAGGYTSHLTAMYSFVNDNEIMVVSPGSSSIELELEDYIFRMSPSDSVYAPILAHLVYDNGFDIIFVLGRDSFVNNQGASFISEYEALGGDIIDVITYDDPNYGYVNALEGIEKVLESLGSNYSNVGIFLVEDTRAGDILQLSESYTCLSNVTWININAYRYPSLNIVPDSFQVKLLSPYPVPVSSSKTQKIEEMYENRYTDDFNFDDACVYDSCMLLGLSIIDLDSTDPNFLCDEIVNFSSYYNGLTGSCRLNTNGDRVDFRMGLFAYGIEELDWVNVGYYDSR